jgi:hypothetical protein
MEEQTQDFAGALCWMHHFGNAELALALEFLDRLDLFYEIDDPGDRQAIEAAAEVLRRLVPEEAQSVASEAHRVRWWGALERDLEETLQGRLDGRDEEI